MPVAIACSTAARRCGSSCWPSWFSLIACHRIIVASLDCPLANSAAASSKTGSNPVDSASTAWAARVSPRKSVGCSSRGATRAGSDTQARRHHAWGDVAACVRAAAGGVGTSATAAPDQIPRGTGAERLRAQGVRQGSARVDEEQVVETAAAECEGEQAAARPGRIGWARLLERVFGIDVQRCPTCGSGELKIIAAILCRAVIERILSHLCAEGGTALSAGTPTPQGAGARGSCREHCSHAAAGRTRSSLDPFLCSRSRRCAGRRMIGIHRGWVCRSGIGSSLLPAGNQI